MSSSISPTSFFNNEKCSTDQLMWTIKDRIMRAHTVENILSPISSRDEYIFRSNPNADDDDDESQMSELSDPFAELGGNIISNAESNQKRRLSKIEADVLVMNSFPPAHMQIQTSLIDESKCSQFPSIDIDSIAETSPTDTILADSESDIEFFQQISASLEQVGLKSHNEKKAEDKEKQQRKSKGKKSGDDQDIDSSSLLSGIWRMLGEFYIENLESVDDNYFKSNLDAASMNDDGFPITQPGYNFFNDREKRLFVRPMEKSWCQKEEVRKKCEEWLKSLNK